MHPDGGCPVRTGCSYAALMVRARGCAAVLTIAVTGWPALLLGDGLLLPRARGRVQLRDGVRGGRRARTSRPTTTGPRSATLLEARAQALDGRRPRGVPGDRRPGRRGPGRPADDALREPPEAPGHVGVLRRGRRVGVPDGEDLGRRPAVPSRGARAGPARRRPAPGDQHAREHLRAARRGLAARRRERPREVPRRPRAAVPALGRARSGSRSRARAGWSWSPTSEARSPPGRWPTTSPPTSVSTPGR